MSSFFSQVSACCQRGRSPTPPSVDENTPLIPPTTQDTLTTVQPSITMMNHQKLKDRLGAIKGKMINVGTPLPLNLHNRALRSRTDPSDSGSRSGSSRPRPTIADVDQEGSYSRTSSPHPSITPSEEHDESRRPILNVRLANDVRIDHSRGRLGRFGEERGMEIKRVCSDGSDDAMRHKEDDGNFIEDKSTAPFVPPVSPSSERPPPNSSSPPEVSSSALRQKFHIKDVGAIARSWRDL